MKVRETKHLLTFFNLLFIIGCWAQQFEDQLFKGIEYGDYDIGFEVVEAYDYSRTYQHNRLNSEISRPMQIAIWYPAKTSQDKLTLQRYIEIGASSELLIKNDSIAKMAVLDFVNSNHIDKKNAERLLQKQLKAGLNAPKADETFPLVIYAPGSSAHWYDNFLLGEFLASKGYVFVASKSRGLNSPTMSMNWPGVESQTRDLEFIRGICSQLDYVNIENTNVIGRSWGAIAALVFSIRQKNTKTICSLDGTLSYNAMALMKDSPYPGGKHVTSPIFLAVGGKRSKNATPIDRINYFEDVEYADAYTIEYKHMRHTAFGSYYLLFHYLLNKGIDNATANELIQGYVYNLNHIAAFLNTYNSLLNSTWEVLSTDIFSFDSQPAKRKLLPSYEDFGYALEVNGVDSAITVYETAAKMDSTYANKELFNANYINQNAYRLLRQNTPNEAISLLQMGIKAFPNNANLYDSLGEMLLIKGKFTDALTAYERALELNPKSTTAKDAIEKIKMKMN